ncbi:hypothetical protein Scel_29550 [Streptomyces cellostaticus]|nr:hypothetical protein Scel_29550 [Streptomyces cellostaticus]
MFVQTNARYKETDPTKYNPGPGGVNCMDQIQWRDARTGKLLAALALFFGENYRDPLRGCRTDPVAPDDGRLRPAGPRHDRRQAPPRPPHQGREGAVRLRCPAVPLAARTTEAIGGRPRPYSVA